MTVNMGVLLELTRCLHDSVTLLREACVTPVCSLDTSGVFQHQIRRPTLEVIGVLAKIS